MAFGSLLCFLQQADRWDDVPCLRRISKQWLRYSLKAAAYGNNNVAECCGITDIAISIQKSGATVKERGHTRSKGLYHQADM